MTALLVGQPAPSSRSRLAAPPAAQRQGPQPWRRSPEEWGAVLARARQRRAFNAPPPATVPVRLYVLDPQERARGRGLLGAGR
ncbi:hypothetical protein AB0A69_10345 [Streptomyces sp. NPDC045431]|uniref:hypothetical protein n=1 Tax=Streptomyces sp. NPDC045431 TaxID=3155613 RepID=UPI0033F45751